ncbi:bifunctional 2-polyprenyl-6-hydroxyphenol methylase/3-demethylubiquinol 3-O-methyltransferase UbiG [Streptosporangium sp. 'caverna']|uniref:class I SAM-dependent methyltransferase n=1 Tax=Streptosporangium sp. 'caverna' TaxID=2202249 RepID=UPI001EF81BF1|nr:methyltransferase domain-containing protein [Streptosporangium sp. 'caverna']
MTTSDPGQQHSSARLGWRESNRAWWDERVPLHAASELFDVTGFQAGRDTLRPFEAAEVGDVTGKTLLHLQCGIGLDTLSWARRGARVTGLDFSEPAIERARTLAAEIGVADARFVAADVYNATQTLEEETFDILYTGIGALCWLPDLGLWARTVASLMAPGGFLYLVERHPIAEVLGKDGRTVTRDYFLREAAVTDEAGSYADQSAQTTVNRSVQWQHGLGDVVSTLVASGLRLEFLHEHAFTFYPQFPVLQQTVQGIYRIPAGQPQVPLVYSLRAAKQ